MSEKSVMTTVDNESEVTSEVHVRTIPSRTIVRKMEEQKVPIIVITNRRTGKKIVNEVPLLADILMD